MSGFEWEFFHRERGVGKKKQTHRQWFSGLPGWLKLAYVLIAIPAWSVMMFNVVTGEPKATSGFIAFGFFFAVVIAALVHEKLDEKKVENG